MVAVPSESRSKLFSAATTRSSKFRPSSCEFDQRDRRLIADKPRILLGGDILSSAKDSSALASDPSRLNERYAHFKIPLAAEAGPSNFRSSSAIGLREFASARADSLELPNTGRQAL